MKKASEGAAYNFRIYTVDENGNLVPEGLDGQKKTTWENAYKMPSNGSAVIDGKTVTWKKGNVIQVAYRINGNVEISVATDSGKLWAN